MKRVVIVVVGIIAVLVTLGGIKALQFKQMMAAASQFTPPPEAVTAAKARRMTWGSILTSVGSLDAVQGVTVTAELAGKVAKIAFTPGSVVREGALLLRQDTSSEVAQLRAIEARLELARTQLERVRSLVGKNVMPASELDTAQATYRQAAAEADNIRATITKKTIRAPFGGRLGIRLVNLGQVLNPGDAIVSLQSIDPIFVNFQLPQQQLGQIRAGLAVRLTTNALPGKVIEGTITAINPQVDPSTRNVEVQATVANTDEQLRPGMFANVEIVLPIEREVVAIPATAVLYAPYSDTVFVVVSKGQGQAGKAASTVEQRPVRLGEKRGDFVAVLEGLQPGETVVATGVFKLRNGQAVAVRNELSPDFKLSPAPEDR